MKSNLNIVLVFLIASPFFFLFFKRLIRSWLNDRKRLKYIWIIGVIGSCLVSSYLLYGVWAKQHLIMRKTEIDVEDYDGKGFEVAIISDLHLGKFNNTVVSRKAIEKINLHESVSYVFVLGDLVNSLEKDLDEVDILCDLDDTKEVYFIYGNHDYSYNGKRFNKIEEKLEECGIRVLKNEIVQLDDGVYLAGSLDIWYDSVKFDYLEEISESDTVILLAHNPDIIQLVSEKVDLVFSGHTHGGELRFPGLGTPTPLPTKLSDEYDKGFFRYGDKDIFITSGVGNTGLFVRSFNYPEVVIMRVK